MTRRMNTPGFTAEWSVYAGHTLWLKAPASQRSDQRTVTPQRIRVYHCTSYNAAGCRECCDLGGLVATPNVWAIPI